MLTELSNNSNWFDTIVQTVLTPAPKLPDFKNATGFFKTVHDIDAEPVYLVRPDMQKGPWIAGGAVMRWYENKPVRTSDIDVFCRDAKQADAVIKRVRNTGRCSIAHESDNAVTLKYWSDGMQPINAWTVQIIRRDYFKDAQSVIDRFDISVCKILTDGYNVVLGEYTARDLRSKTLRMNMPLRNDAAKRYIKYLTYGYRPVDGLHDAVINNPESIWTFNSEGGEYEGM